MRAMKILMAILLTTTLSTTATAGRGDLSQAEPNPLLSLILQAGSYANSEECAEVESTCVDLWMVVYDQCMGPDVDEFETVDPEEQEVCFSLADYAYEECMFGADC